MQDDAYIRKLEQDFNDTRWAITEIPYSETAHRAVVDQAYCDCIDGLDIEIKKRDLAISNLLGRHARQMAWQRTRLNRLLGFTAMLGAWVVVLAALVWRLW